MAPNPDTLQRAVMVTIALVVSALLLLAGGAVGRRTKHTSSVGTSTVTTSNAPPGTTIDLLPGAVPTVPASTTTSTAPTSTTTTARPAPTTTSSSTTTTAPGATCSASATPASSPRGGDEQVNVSSTLHRAGVAVFVHFRNEEVYTATTDDSGQAAVTFAVPDTEPPGEIGVDVDVSGRARCHTSFTVRAA